MKFLSHVKKNKQDEIIYRKEIIKHISNMLGIIDGYYLPNSNGYRELILRIIRLHDLGKYTKFFQEYILSGKVHPMNYHFHTLIGACSIFNSLFQENLKDALIAYFVIYHHHSNLGNITRCFPEDRVMQINDRLNSQYQNIFPNLHLIREELLIPLDCNILAKERLDLLLYTDDLQNEKDIQNYFQINYLFSLLIEADKLDASDTPVYNRIHLPIDKVDSDKGIPIQLWDEDMSDFKHLSQNQLRDLVRKRVIENLSNENILDQKLFTLTGPTGIGKTLTALDFALKLRSKIKEAKGYEAQIIYALPFINIIEQSDTVYRKLFNDTDVKILSHYQYADALSQQEDKYTDDGTDYNQKIMSLDTWQCDIVITTFVQFLQTLIGNRNKLLKKFNHYAGSIIILDEVQTIALKHLPLVGASLYYLSKFLDARIILMTATKPKVFELANTKILKVEGDEAKPLELLGSDNDVAKVFKSFNRTKLKPLLEKPIQNQEEFIADYFKIHWEADKSCLVVVNTVKLSIDVYNSVTSYFDDEGIKNPVYYLSTNIVPAGRQALIENIKADIQKARKGEGLKPLLISTQCVEAGVDLDFDMAFRDLAPIDSIIQVAGRVNRENNKEFVGTIVIVDFGKCGRIYGPMTEDTARSAIQYFTLLKDEIYEKEYLELVTYYYDHICERNNDGFDFSLNFFKSMKELNYDGSEWSVSKYQVIENGFKTSSVFIECDETATKAKEIFEKMIRKECGREDFEKNKRDFHQHIIAVPNYLDKIQELKLINSIIIDDILYVKRNDLKEYYNPITGFIREKIEESWGTIL